jgi:hypothetical protein
MVLENCRKHENILSLYKPYRMIEKIGSVKNPLTIIEIFAGIAEVSGTTVLPFISPENQGIFIYF